MKCELCGGEITLYELYPRSYRLYAYICLSCRKGFLAHHFDIDLEIYRMDEVSLSEGDGLLFITGLKAEPRVFEYRVERDAEAVIVADEAGALGELAPEKRLFAPYSEKAMRRIKRLLRLPESAESEEVAEEVAERWERTLQKS